jgi:hypothetical protein
LLASWRHCCQIEGCFAPSRLLRGGNPAVAQKCLS